MKKLATLRISVIICTHNPRAHYLQRVLDSLQAQTLSKDQWELLLIDNASVEKLEDRFDLSWHPRANFVIEEKLGLTQARLRGIAESIGEVLVFVDDDNVLASDYLAQVITIGNTLSMMGAWGGSSRGEYEIEPSTLITPYLGYLAILEINDDYWSNLNAPLSVPFGAGLCVRRNVAEKYFDNVRSDPLRLALDRKGSSMASGGDTDIALTAVDIGLGTGRFHVLKLTHLIPKERLTEDYIIRLLGGLLGSDVILRELRPSLYPSTTHNTLASILRYWYNYIRSHPLERKIIRATENSKKFNRNLIDSAKGRNT